MVIRGGDRGRDVGMFFLWGLNWGLYGPRYQEGFNRVEGWILFSGVRMPDRLIQGSGWEYVPD